MPFWHDVREEGKIGLISNVVQPVGCFRRIRTINRLSSLPGGANLFHVCFGVVVEGGGLFVSTKFHKAHQYSM